jgi:diacylglycerol O-acyltransferase / wax synthase
MAANGQRPEAFTTIDAAWLRMDQPTNLMMIVGVLMFDEPLDFARLQQVITERLLCFERFRQRVTYPQGPAGPPHWVFDEHFDIRAHLRRIALPAPGDQQALEQLVSDFMSTPLDPTKPLWQFHLIENYGGGCALLSRLHHCIADGIALVRVLLSMTDAIAEPEQPPAPEPAQRGFDPLGAATKQAAAAFAATSKAANAAYQEGVQIWNDPLRLLDRMQDGAASLAAMSKLLTLPPDPPTLLKGQLGVTKLAVWSPPIALDEVKKVGRVTASTINDVMLACVAGALRRYLLHRGASVEDLSIRAAVPVNLRPLDAPLELGNRFSLIFLSLPIGIEHPLERLIALKENMDELKGSAEALVAWGILNAIGGSPEPIQRTVVNIFGSKATGVMTNVPGPRQTIFFAGKPISDIMFWVPQSGYLGLGVSILSYAGNVRLGVCTDAGLVPDPEQIIAGFQAEFDALHEMMDRAQAIQSRMSSEF